jgi:ATP-dependent Clp protease ATP-binding subunit ClpA
MLELKLQNSINKTMVDAKNKNQEFITVEHLLLALTNVEEVVEFFNKKQVEIDKLKIEISEFIGSNVPTVATNSNNSTSNSATSPTVGFQRVLQRSVFNAQSAKKTVVNGLNVLVSIFAENESHAVYLLKLNNISKLEVMQELSADVQVDANSVEGGAKQIPQKTFLEKWTTNLNELAKAGKIDPLVGREEEITRIMQILSKRRKNNPILVGEPGVGKTALAGGLALKIVNGKVSKNLLETKVYSLDVADLVAGTKYRGEFEERLKKILEDIKKDKNSVVFIDEIHMLIGAGNSSSGMDAANLLKPALADGTLRCMGSTTDSEYRKIFDKNEALSRRFQKVDILEPSKDETLTILKGLQDQYGTHHQVKYSEESLKAAVDLSTKYITTRKLPDKAIDVIDEAGSFEVISGSDKKSIEPTDIENIVANMTKIPVASVNQNDNAVLKHLSDNIKLSLFGQNEAVDSITTAVKLSRGGMSSDDKPIGSFLFAGPTGVGKTELAKQLSQILGVKLLRFDMSEYMDRHSNAKLIGSPPGFVGYEEGGLLTEEVHKHPYAIVLLDEIEKAHPDIFNLFLQVMDNGKLTDSNGRVVDFTNVLMIMTSNVGAFDAQKNSIGFNENNSNKQQSSLEKTFTPEFRNRLSQVLYFNQLDENTILSVVDKFIFAVENKLSTKNIDLSVSLAAKKWLAKNGYDQKMGARPMGRLIEKEINTPLADEILFGKLSSGGSVKIGLKKDKLTLNYI